MDPIAVRPVVAVMVPPKPGAKPREVLVDLETVRVIITAFADARTALTAAQAALDACKALDAMQAAALEEAKHDDTWTKAGPEYPDVSGGGVPYPAQPFGSLEAELAADEADEEPDEAAALAAGELAAAEVDEARSRERRSDSAVSDEDYADAAPPCVARHPESGEPCSVKGLHFEHSYVPFSHGALGPRITWPVGDPAVGGEGGMLIGPFAHDPDGDGEMPANVRPLHSPAFLAIHQDTFRGAAVTIPGSAR